MFADPRYYVFVVLIYAGAYFLQPDTIAFKVGLIYRVNSIVLLRAFRWNRPFRAWSTGTSLAASLIAPALVGTHPMSMAPLALGWALLMFSDFRHLAKLAREAAEPLLDQTGKSD
jgi:hypothetical protein